MRGWNSHSLQSERNWTPEQLWANGMMDLHNSHVSHVAEVQESINSETLEDLEWFGMDWYAPTPSNEGLSNIELLDVDVPLFQNLTANVNPLQYLQSHEIDIFYTRYESCFKLVGLMYTNADLKIFQYVHVHTKLIPREFLNLNPKSFRITYQ